MAYKKKEVSDKKDYRQELTDNLIKKIDSLIIEIYDNPNKKWNKTWFTCNERPVNPATGTIYSGINVISLLSKDFNDNRFYTYNNVAEMEKVRAKNVFDSKELSDQLENKLITHTEYDKKMSVIETSFLDLEKKGLLDRTLPIHVQKGASGVPVFKAVEMEFKNGSNPEGEEIEINNQSVNKIWMNVFAGNVFNASQIANLKPKHEHNLDFIPHEEVELHLEAIINKTNLKFNEIDQGRAFYSPSNHSITMPLRESFESSNDFYSVLLHEIGHSTGPKLERNMSGGFGSKSYAFEEFVADISSSFMCSDLGIPYNPNQHENHVAYLKSWSKALGEDKNLIFKAASQAEKSVKYQHSIRNEYKLELAQKQEHRNDLKEVVEPMVLNQNKNKPSMSLSR